MLAKLQVDSGLREKLQGAADLDAAIALAKESGFDVSKADWMKYQASQPQELSDEELESVAGGGCSIARWEAGWAQPQNKPSNNRAVRC